MDGLAMLVNQGVIGIKYWTGVDADVTVMRKALEKALLALTQNRTAMLIVDCLIHRRYQRWQEPWFLGFEADVEFHVVVIGVATSPAAP